MKNYIIKILIASVIILGIVSCADLDLPSDGRMTLEDIFMEYNTTRSYFNRCFDYMPQVGFSYGDTPLASFCDEAHDASDGVSGVVNDWYNNRTSSSNNPLTVDKDPWKRNFEGIRKCNTFLKCINDPAIATARIDENEKNGWIGEALVLRSFYYLQLVKRYGGVPIIGSPYEVTHDFSNDSRAAFEACIDFIIDNCDSALAIPESGKANIGFRWNISDNERGRITRAFAYAVKSQAALYAASPLWHTSGSKYTWDKATEITKEALDACLAHGFQLFGITPDPDIAQNAYAYYFIYRSDPSRSVDKETIFETTSDRTNVWKWAGTPITEGVEKAGAGPSQELVDAYGMQATGEMPVLGYSDASHLQPMVNTASGYDPAHPYAGRDPRFYASIYYNESPRSLTSGKVDKDLFPLSFIPSVSNNVSATENGEGITLSTTGGDPWIFTTTLTRPLSAGARRVVSFEYKSNKTVNDAEFFFCVAGGPQGGVESGQNIVIEQASEWTRFEYDLTSAINTWGFGVNANGGAQPKDHFFRFDLTGGPGYEITIRNFRVESFTPPPAATPVETYVGGNCEISDRVSEIHNTRTGYYMRKFNNYKSGVNVDQDGLMKIFRLGELYLNFAEAAYNSVGPDAAVPSKIGGPALSARDAINLVRERAEMPPLSSGLSREDFEIRYRNERQVELAFEEHRFFDVRRWKILTQTDGFVTGMKINKNNDVYTYTRIKLKDRGTNSEKYLMYPISQSEVSKMNGYTDANWQNPGW